MSDMKEFGDRLRRWPYSENVVRLVLDTIRLEQENITFKRPPHIIQEIQEAIDRIVADAGEKHLKGRV